jgi:hypothetical protein
VHCNGPPQVYYFPADALHLRSHPREFLMLAVLGLITSFTSTLMFTALGSFYNRISDPDMVRLRVKCVNGLDRQIFQVCWNAVS